MRKDATGSTATGGLQELTGRITVVVVLFVAAAVFFHLNGELLKDNRKMIKYIKSEEVFKRDLAALDLDGALERQSTDLLESTYRFHRGEFAGVCITVKDRWR